MTLMFTACQQVRVQAIKPMRMVTRSPKHGLSVTPQNGPCSDGPRISCRGRQPRRGVPTPEVAMFQKICMSKRKNLDPWGTRRRRRPGSATAMVQQNVFKTTDYFQFIADYHGEDRFLTRIGVGGLINMEKIEQAHTVLNDIHLFQQRSYSTLPGDNVKESLTSLRNSQEFTSVRYVNTCTVQWNEDYDHLSLVTRIWCACYKKPNLLKPAGGSKWQVPENSGSMSLWHKCMGRSFVGFH